MSVKEELERKYGKAQEMDYSSVDAYKASMQASVDAAVGASPYKETYKRFDSLYNQLRTDTKKFLTAADMDTSGDRRFNAADYFEERKKQANALKQRAAALSLYLEDNADAYTPESYDSMMQTLSTFDTEVDDVLSYYQPSVDSRTGMRAYEDEMIVAMERNEQFKSLDRQALFGLDNTSPAYNLLESMMRYRNDESYRAMSDSWTDEERYILGQLQREDPAKARDFAIQVNNYYNAQSTEDARENIRKNAVANKGKSTAAALLASTFTAPGEFADRLAENMARGTTTEKKYVSPWEYAQEVTGAISDDLNQQYGTLNFDQSRQFRDLMDLDMINMSGDYTAGLDALDVAGGLVEGKGMGDVYNLGYNVAQNALSRFTLGALGGEAAVLGNYFMSAATSGIDEARKVGASGNQAMLSGILKGASEVLTEKAPLDELFKMGPAVTWGDLFKLLGKQSLVEGLGEGANSILGYVSDQLVLGDLSEYSRTVQEYISQGASQRDAEYMAFRDVAKNVGFEALSGMLSGIASAGGKTVKNTVAANYAYRSVDPRALIDAGLETDSTSKAYAQALQMQEQLDNDQRISGNQKRVLAQNTELQKLAAIVAKKSAGEELTRKENRTIRKNQNVQTLLNTMEYNFSGNSSSESVPEANTSRRTTEDAQVAENTQVPKNGRAIQYSTQQGVEAYDFAQVEGGKNGKITVQLKDGSVADINDLVFESEAEEDRFRAVATLPGIDTETANNLLHTIQDAGAGADLDSIVGIREAYRLGMIAASRAELANSDANVLSEELRNAVYDMGLHYRNSSAQAKVTARKVDVIPTKGYKKVVLEGNIVRPKDKKLQKKMDSEIAFIDYISDKFSGTAVHIFQSYERDGKMYFTDTNGVEQLAPNGKYSNGEIWLDINAGDNENGMVLNTFAHEMYHHIERANKAAANRLAEFVVKELGLKSVDAAVERQIKNARAAGYGEKYFTDRGYTEDQAANEVYMRAMSDFVADSLETVFTRGDVSEAIARLHNEDRGLFHKVKKFIDQWVKALKDYYKGQTISQEGYEVSQLKNFEELQRMFMEAMKGAGDNYRAAQEALSPGEDGLVTNQNGDIVAMSTEDGSVMLSLRTYDDDGRKAFRKYLQKCVSRNRLTEQQAQEMRDGIEEIYSICKEFKDKYAPFSSWSDAEVIRDTRGRPVFSVVTPNGDYKMNLDFSLVCKKRRTLDAVFNEMARRGIIDDFELGQKSVVKINEIIRKHGLETACALCFVDAKRFRQASMADQFTRLYNELVESLVPEDQKGSIDHFNFSGYGTIKKVDGGIDTWDNSKLDFSHINHVLKTYGDGTVEYKAAKYIKSHPEGRKLLLRGDFMSSHGFDAVKSQNQNILKLYNSKKGTGGPKAAFGDVQYLNEIIRKERTWTPAKAYEVGGVRIQSFSDYVPRMVFDYVQMIYDLAASKLPAHAYTKEALFVKQFGLTGVKINMSLIPAVVEGGIAPGLDANGNYVWAGESFNYDEAVDIQNADGYSENCGTICVGVSKQHIEKLLRDPNIRMVIPYHKSGLNPIVAHMNKIAEFTDYTSLKTNPGGCQNTVDKNGKKIAKEFNFNEALKKYRDPKAAANAYLKWCAANQYTAKFAEFAGEENYYKLLEDFNLYDKDGNYVPQREVKAVFPKESNAFGSMRDLIESGLQEDAIVEGKRDKNLSSIVDEIQRTLPKTEAEISEEQVAQADRDLEASQPTSDVDTEMNSLRNQRTTIRDILTQVDPSTRNGAERYHLSRYQERVELLADLEPQLENINAKLQEIPADDKSRKKERMELMAEARNLRTRVTGLKRDIRNAEQYDMMRKIVAEEKLKAQQQEAKENASIWEKEFIRIVKKFEKLDEKTGKRTIKDTTTIKELKEALKAEAKSHKEDSAIWEKEFNRLLRDYETGGRRIELLEATIKRQRATAKARVESRRKTELRHKIQRKADELNRLLTRGTKHRNIAEFLQPAVADILDAINMEVREGEQRRKTFEANLARYDRRIAATSDPVEVSRLIAQRNEYEAKGDQFANKMEKLQDAYQQIRENKIPNLEIDDGLADALDRLLKEVGDTPLGQMTEAQLEAVNEVLNITKATITNANKMFQEGQRMGVSENSQITMGEVRSVGGGPKKHPELVEKIKQFNWENMKPVYVFEAIGSKKLLDLYENLRKGEDTLALDLKEAKDFFQENWKKFDGRDWDREQKWEFTSTSGKKFELNLDQIMSLYALSKRDQARDHLRVGGFSFDSQYKVKDEVKVGPVKFKAEVKNTDASAYNLSDEILGEIIGKLTPEQRRFVDQMQAYLSDNMAAKGNQISMRKYGIRLFKDKNYFPLRVSDQYMAKVREQQTGDRKLKNSGFTKELTPEAKNPVVLSSFLEVWAEHVDEMSLYHSFVLPLDDMERVLNYHDQFLEGEAAGSVAEAIQTAYGKSAMDYIDNLLRDVNGGKKGDNTAKFVNNMLSSAKKAQTMASLSVAIQQPSAVLRAMSMVDSRYFLGARVTEKTHDRTWEEIKQYAPVALIKERGGFDTNVSRSTVEYLTDTAEYNGIGENVKGFFTDSKYRDDLFGWLPGFMDEAAWSVIWNAVKREQAALHSDMDVNGRAFMQLVANRFTEVITHTQVYDSVFSRSGLMRSADTGVKMATSFMAEPTTTLNMLQNAILQRKRGEISNAQAAKTVGSIVASLALNAALVSLVYALRDDDKDKRYDEKWLENFTSNFLESMNPVTYIPFLRDIVSMIKGYDVERADMTLLGDVINAITGLKDEKRTAWEKTETVLGSVGNLLGVPLKNILRDGKGIVNTVRIALDEESRDHATKTGRYMALRGMDLTDGAELILAIQQGDEEHIQRVYGRFKSQDEAQSALQSAIGSQYREGKLTAEEAEQLLTDNFDRDDEHEVYWLFDKWDYAKENGTTEGWTKYGQFMRGVASGDYQTEMERLMEHGADASDIRSQISRAYRKQYLEGDGAERQEIRELVEPVYKATGMHDDEIQKKFHEWDFEAEFGMTYGEMKGEFRDGNVTENELREAMKFQGMKIYEIEKDIRNLKEETQFQKKFGMSLAEMKDGYDRGDVTRNTMISGLIFDGMSRSEAQKWVTQRDISNQMGIDYAELDDAYKYGDISRNDLRNAILKSGETVQATDEAMAGYDWLKKNVNRYPDLSISDAKKFAVRIHSDYAPDETLEDYGVSIDAYIEYQRLRPECKGVDANGDGKIDDGTLRDSIFQMIDSLPITNEAKDGLALMSYSAKSIRRNAPWH